jgi:hypothetical protein
VRYDAGVSTLPDAFYIPDGDGFVSTVLTRGPWSPKHQHGGPPCALLAGALERAPGGESFFLARVTYDYLKPVPVTRLTLRLEEEKLGRAVQRWTATLAADGEDVLRARGLRIRRRTLEGMPPPPPAPPLPSGPPYTFTFFHWQPAYHSALELHFQRGTWGDRDIFTWARPRVPLVQGRPLSGVERVAVIADAESGLCPPLAIDGYTFVNPDLTLVLDREPEGEWVGLHAVSTASSIGLGVAQAGLYDARGQVGRSAQTLVVEPRQR